MKKLSIGLALICSTLSVSTFAALPTGASRFCVNVPSYCGGFTFGLAGLYLRPSTPELDYAMIFDICDCGGVEGGRYKSVDPKYQWGFNVNIGYVIPCTGNDINLSYTDYNENEHNRVGPTDNTTILGALAPFDFSTNSFATSTASAKATFNYQALDLEFGQAINIGCLTRFRFFGGARYSNLDNHLDATYLGNVTLTTAPLSESFIFETTQKTRFKRSRSTFWCGCKLLYWLWVRCCRTSLYSFVNWST